jgi:hypothetical protein
MKQQPRSGCGARTASEEDGDESKQGDEGDDGLRSDAVKAPDAKDMRFDVAEVKGVDKSYDGEEECGFAAAKERQHADDRVSRNAEDGDGNAVKDGVTAVIDDAAVPVSVDIAGLDVIREVNMEGECGNDDAGQGQESNHKSHSVFILRKFTAASLKAMNLPFPWYGIAECSQARRPND